MSVKLEERLKKAVKEEKYLCMLKVVAGHIADPLYDSYDEYMDFGLREHHLLEASSLPDPDRLELKFNGLVLQSATLSSTIGSMLPDSYYLSDFQVDLIADVLESLYIFLTDDNIVPEEMTEYG